MRIEHDAVTDDRQLALPHHAGWQQRQLIGRPINDQRVASIMAALEPDDDVGLFRQPIDDLALALVPPLGADHDNVRHKEQPDRPMNTRMYRVPAAADCPGYWMPPPDARKTGCAGPCSLTSNALAAQPICSKPGRLSRRKGATLGRDFAGRADCRRLVH